MWQCVFYVGKCVKQTLAAALLVTFCSAGDHPSRDRRSTSRCRSAFAATFPANTHSILSIRLDLSGAGYTKHGHAHLAMASPGLARGELVLLRSTNKRIILSWIRRFTWDPPTGLSVRFRQRTGTCSEGVFDPALREPQCGKLVIFLVTGKIHAQAAYPRLRRKGIYLL